MPDFGLVKSFDIDNGELDGQSPQQCFVLGYELALIDELVVSSANGFDRPIHVENRHRIAASCREAGRKFSLTWMPGDVSESWLLLVVEPL